MGDRLDVLAAILYLASRPLLFLLPAGTQRKVGIQSRDMVPLISRSYYSYHSYIIVAKPGGNMVMEDMGNLGISEDTEHRGIEIEM